MLKPEVLSSYNPPLFCFAVTCGLYLLSGFTLILLIQKMGCSLCRSVKLVLGLNALRHVNTLWPGLVNCMCPVHVKLSWLYWRNYDHDFLRHAPSNGQVACLLWC